MDVNKSVREFKYNGVALKDPDPTMSIEQVRETFSALYPEIVNAEIEGPEMVGNKTIYEFRRAVGTKGAALRERLEATMAGKSPLSSPLSFPFDLAGHQPLAKAFAACVRAPRDGERLAAPSAFLSLLP